MIGAIKHTMRNGKLAPQYRNESNSEIRSIAERFAEPSTPHLLRAICINPRHQRPRCVMYSETPSGARPMLSRSFRYAVFQPDSFSLSDSSMSSVTLSVGKPPTCCSASRRVTEEVPQQNATPQASLEASSTSKKKRCSSGHLLAAPNPCCG